RCSRVSAIRRSGRRLGFIYHFTALAYSYPDRLIGIHLNMMPLRRDPKMVADPTSEEQKYLEQLTTWLKDGTGYQWIQGTRPQTLAFALTDSPLGHAAWIIEKFRAWSDCS